MEPYSYFKTKQQQKTPSIKNPSLSWKLTVLKRAPNQAIIQSSWDFAYSIVFDKTPKIYAHF